MSGNIVLRWAIMGTGGICTEFCQDLLVDPSLRGVNDITHKITAVGSRSKVSAQKFIDKLSSGPTEPHWDWSWGVKKGLLEAIPYDKESEVFESKDVDVVYIGTPPPNHYATAKGALLAGKHILIEKPVVFDVNELDELTALAKEKNLFFMEAVWTRFQPIADKVREVIRSGVLGRPKRFTADFSMDHNLDERAEGVWSTDPKQGGGSLLDMGPYPSVWAMLLVQQSPHNTDPSPQVLTSHQTVYPKTGCDVNSRWLVEWQGLCQGHLTTDLNNAGLREATAWVQCEEGDLVVEYPPYRPDAFHIIPRPDRFPGKITKKETFHIPVAKGTHGLAYEADEVARCISRGQVESQKMTWEESRIVQTWFDHVRKNGPTHKA